MAICPECGAQLNETSKFCPECGKPVPVRTEEVAADIYSDKFIETENAESVLKDIDISSIPSDEAAEILEAAAEKALEDIPEIIKINSVTDFSAEELHRETSEHEDVKSALSSKDIPESSGKSETEIKTDDFESISKKSDEKPRTFKDDFSDFGAYNSSDFDPKLAQSFGNNNSDEDKPKKKRVALIALIAVIVAVAAAGCIVCVLRKNRENIAASVTEIPTDTSILTVGYSDVMTETSAETQIQSEETEISASEAAAEVSESISNTVSEISVSETENSVEESAAEVALKSSEELASGVVIIPEHKYAAEGEASCEFSLAANGLTSENLTDDILLIVEFTADAPANGTIPVSTVATVINGDISADTRASSSGDGVSVFEYSKIVSSANEAGISANQIDNISFKGSGAGVDVLSVTVMNG